MNLTKVEVKNYKEIITECWKKDPKIQQYSRNYQCNLQDRVTLEVEALNTNDSLIFYCIYDKKNNFIGYFGIENKPFDCLTTMFILPEYRKNKDLIWDYIISHLPKHFYAGLFKINTRAINFYKNKGAKEVMNLTIENKDSILLEFRGN